MRENLPLVSVIVPAYNHEVFVEQAIRSVWNQTYKNVEIIVLNDGSTDNTSDVITELLSYSPINMIFRDKKNEGVSKTLNYGISLAKGDFIAVLASDDFYSKNFIEKYIDAALSCGNEYGIFHCDGYEVNANNVIGSKISNLSRVDFATGDCFFDILEGKSKVISSTVMFRASLLHNVGVFDESLTQEDLDFHLRMARFTKFYYVNETLFYSRKLAGSLGRSPERWIHDGEIAINKHKDYIGATYNNIMKKKFERNIVICLNGSYYSGAAHYFFKLYSASETNVEKISIVINSMKRITYFSLRNFLAEPLKKSPKLENHIRKLVRKMKK